MDSKLPDGEKREGSKGQEIDQQPEFSHHRQPGDDADHDPAVHAEGEAAVELPQVLGDELSQRFELRGGRRDSGNAAAVGGGGGVVGGGIGE